MRIVLLRHGKTPANENRLYCGASDPGLSEEGKRELLMLKGQIAYPDLQGMEIITSGMRRTDETLRLIFDRAPDRREAGFREMDFGRFEMHSYEELKDDPAYRAWIADETGRVACPGGESALAFRERVREAFRALERDALVLCHGGVIAQIMADLFPEEGRHMYGWQPEFGRGYALECEASRWRYDPV